MSKELIERIVKNIPSAEMKMPAVIVDGQTYTWEQVLAEIKKSGEMADKIQRKIEEMQNE